MRLWSLHPRLLDRRGLVALWREGLLAQAVLRGRTRGYTRHPQLERFLAAHAPLRTLATYLGHVADEATRRGYGFDRARIARTRDEGDELVVTRGQLAFEWSHLRGKLQRRDTEWLRELPGRPRAHPIMRLVTGDIEQWERGHGHHG